MKKRNNNPIPPEPPRWAVWILSSITASDLSEEILGDMHELFQRRAQRSCLLRARLLYTLDMLLLLHPRLWRRPATVLKRSKFTFDSQSNPMAMLGNHFKIAFRKLVRQKSYTTINAISLSLGIASSILIFTLVKYHLSFEDFHQDQKRIFRVYTELHDDNVRFNPGVPNPMGEALRSGYSVTEKVGRIAFLSKRVVAVSPVKKFEDDIAFADADFLDIFNFPLLQGDLKTSLKEPNTALITEKIAHKYFGALPALGQLLYVDDSLTVRITGILKDLPANTDFRSEIFLPFENLKDHTPWMVEKDWWYSVDDKMQCFVKLSPGVDPAIVSSKILPDISEKHYDKKMARHFRFKLQPLSDVHFNAELNGKADKKNLRTFALIGAFLLLTACINFINLATAQALGRSREIGIRKVLGSQQTALFWQFIAETAVICCISMVLALLIAQLAVPFVNQLFEIRLKLSPNTYLLAFLSGLLFMVVFLSGAYPGIILSRFQPITALKGIATGQSISGFSMRKSLIVGQFTISQLLIIGTLIVTNQLRYSQMADMGFKKDAVVMLSLPGNQKSKLQALSAELSQIPAVEKVTFFDSPPASETVGNTGIQYDSRPELEHFPISIKATDDQYISTFEIPVLAGRNLNPSDTIREYLINESAVKALKVSSTKEVIGKSAVINGRTGTIVGVVKDFHFLSFRKAIGPLCLTTRSENYSKCAVKVNLTMVPATLNDVQKIWTTQYPSAVYSYRFLDQEIERFYKSDRMLLRLIQAFAGIAVFVGCLGLYGLISFMAARKTKEIGVRKVLGASTASILWLFGKEFFQLLLTAFLLAAPLAWWLGNGWLNNFAYRIEPGAGIFLLAISITILVAILTVGLRSLKASQADPVKTLKSE